jgi:hypothetical protein
MDQHSSHVRAVALALAERIEAECCPDPTPAEVPGRRARFDRQRAAGLIADLVVAMVEVEREQCAELAARLEPSFPGTIAMLIRDRRLRG